MRQWTAITAVAITAMLVTGNPVQASSAAANAASVPKAAVPMGNEHAAGAELQQHIQAWADQLAKQPAFQAWKSAAKTVSPLGPGTHGWLVTFTAAGKPAGYMIVNATPEGGYQLGEYGVGSHPAFDPNTMYNALIRQGLIENYSEIAKKPLHLERLYHSPMLAAWKWKTAAGETYFLDAWTGEALPVTEEDWLAQTKLLDTAKSTTTNKTTALPGPYTLDAVRTNQAFDPYERMPWLTNAPLSRSQLAGLTEMLDKLSQIRYTAELFNSTVLYVLPAVGYHRWNDSRLFVAFDQSFPGTRYISFDHLNREGRFYR
ncbi:hypothetical protein GXP70_19480 [Paenibacillus lycopersici]|uniref:Uncharacterized protein n=1 Tax=Paenibacillus lycopersici TaxID=2704462 RepID=A0A6C0FZ68_9BACL|nr:hypothetical protein [Paenibacillus lycopersici]QHT61947.1 hypothetical protein GXP70_19480 [Paenibacillus lycopersici]